VRAQHLVGLRPTWRDQHEHGVVRRSREVPVEQRARALLQLVHVAQYDDAPFGEHGRGAEQGIQRLGIELARATDLEIEVARGRFYRRVDEIAGRLLLQEIVFAEEVVDRIEDARLEGCVKRLLPCGCHGGNIGRIVPVATAATACAVRSGRQRPVTSLARCQGARCAT
jgi:hypothetical protein